MSKEQFEAYLKKNEATLKSKAYTFEKTVIFSYGKPGLSISVPAPLYTGTKPFLDFTWKIMTLSKLCKFSFLEFAIVSLWALVAPAFHPYIQFISSFYQSPRKLLTNMHCAETFKALPRGAQPPVDWSKFTPHIDHWPKVQPTFT